VEPHAGRRRGAGGAAALQGTLAQRYRGEAASRRTAEECTLFKSVGTALADLAVAAQVSQVMGRRVTLQYDQKVGLPTSCFGETRHFVNKVTVSEEIPLAAGVRVPTHPASAASAPAPAASR